MKASAARLSTLLATAAAGVLVAIASPPAAAVTETNEILVTSQWGGSGCANNQRLLVANPFTGALIANLGTPNTSFGVFNEAKPFDSNRKIVAVWGGSAASNQLAGVGVYDRVAGAWTTSFALPSTFERGANSPHSITVLPDGYFAVAHVGTISGVTNAGFVVIFSPTGTKLNHYQLSSAHGVEYDTLRNRVFAVGMSVVRKYTYDPITHTLTQQADYPLPTTGGAPGGHDLRRRRTDNDYSVTTNQQGHVFDPETGTFTTLRKSDNSAIGGGVKSVDQRYDGITEYNWYNETVSPPDTFNFLHRSSVAATFCTNFYKAGRWLYAQGTPDFDDGGTPTTPTWSPTFTVGGGANTWWIEIYTSSDVSSLDVIGNNGQFFMSNVTKQTWGAFAQSPPVELLAGSPIKLIARRASDGASAASITFPWLNDSSPDTETGWAASFTVHQCASKVEATISSVAVRAEVRIGTTTWAAMTKNATTGRWERTPGVPAGTKYVVRAYLAPGGNSDPTAYSAIHTC